MSDASQVGSYWDASTGFNSDAVLWNGTSSSMVSLHPAGMYSSCAYAASGNQQVGTGSEYNYLINHAFLWSGTAASAIDLTPAGIDSCGASGIGGNEQVGWGSGVATGNSKHALLWTGTADSAIDLHPPGYADSVASDTDGLQQVGYATINAAQHAMLWAGTSASAVDLHPAGLTLPGFTSAIVGSEVEGVSGAQQVGFGAFDWGDGTMVYAALMWTGSSDTVVSLNPTGPGHSYSQANATNGLQQVGWTTQPKQHACVWSGTASSVVNLHPYLPLALQGSTSAAYDIDASGNIIGSAGNHAILWQPALWGDANLDRCVSFADYLTIEANFGKTNMGWAQGDFNDDGKVSFADYLMLEPNFGKSIPEPVTLSLLAGGCILTLCRRPLKP